MTLQRDVRWVLDRLDRMHDEGIWPNGLRYLWTDAFGITVYLGLHRETGDRTWVDKAQRLVADVERVLGRPRGVRIGEAPDRDGQYYHYLAMWLYALGRLGRVVPEYQEKAVRLAKDLHPAFVRPREGVVWKMKEDLSGPYPGSGLGALDAFHGYMVYRQLDPERLSGEIAEMETIIKRTHDEMDITQDLALGMMLWITSAEEDAEWARLQHGRSVRRLDSMWHDPPGYFSRTPYDPDLKFAFTNHGVSIGLQAANLWPERVERLHGFFDTYRSGDRYDTDAITHVMACAAHLPIELMPSAHAVSR